MSELILTNARVVTEGQCFLGTLIVEEGLITAIDRGPTRVAGAINCEGDHILPGLIELHTDNLERHVAPRPGVRWPALAATLSHDAQIVASGVTTVFDAVSIGDIVEGSDRLRNLKTMVGAVTESVGRKLTRARHYLHLRCEVSYEDLETLLLPLIDEPLVRLVSMMDHAPGQRQFKDVEAYARYYRDSFKLDEETFQTLLERHVRSSKECAAKHRTMVAAACRERNLPMASHDDTTAEHVEESEALGMKIAEFPTTAEAARLSHDKGLAVMMGAPNLVRGHSHSGNVSAMDMAEGGSLDILSSDYMPSSLLMGVLKLWHTARWHLPDAVALVTRNPARVAGLNRLGVLAEGNIGDAIRVRFDDDVAVVRNVWRAGERIL